VTYFYSSALSYFCVLIYVVIGAVGSSLLNCFQMKELGVDDLVNEVTKM